jgi:hypothetical protein
MNSIIRILLLAAVGLFTGCDPKVSDQDLSFLATQKKPLTAKAVFNQLGKVEVGPGAYVYHFRGTNKVVEFWMSPPPLPSQPSAKSLPVEVALVTVRAEGAKREIIWPEDLKGKDFDEAMGAFWPQRQ